MKPPTANKRTARILPFVIIGLLLIVVVAIYTLGQKQSAELPEVGSEPEQAVLDIVERYVQAKENRVGADQKTATDWLNTVKPIVTKTMFERLKPSGKIITSSIPFNYTYAHQKKYIVKTELDKCIWGGEGFKPSKDENGGIRGVVVCSLIDKTVSSETGSEVPASNIEFGWPYNGKQQSPVIELTLRNGQWLINADETGNAS